MMKRPAQSLSYVGPIAARHSIMLHLMQDLLHWAHKLARNGLVELGCVSRGPENDCKGNWDKKYRRNAWVIQTYVLSSRFVTSAGKDFSRFASTIKSDR